MSLGCAFAVCVGRCLVICFLSVVGDDMLLSIDFMHFAFVRVWVWVGVGKGVMHNSMNSQGCRPTGQYDHGRSPNRTTCETQMAKPN